MQPYEILLYIFIFLYGLVIGSFVNVLIYRLPAHENIATVNSHCMSCGHRLQWYDLVPLFSWLALKGRCRYCGEKISIQYPMIEAINGAGYVLIFVMNGFTVTSVCYALAYSMLVAIAVIDWRTYEIPAGLNIAILCFGLIRAIVLWAMDGWAVDTILYYGIGMISVSLFLFLLFVLTKGRGIGGGDIKLMAAAGLLLGWKHILLALVLGCIFGSVIHLILMKVRDKGRVLAFGPYLSLGIFLTMLFGDPLIDWYMGFFA